MSVLERFHSENLRSPTLALCLTLFDGRRFWPSGGPHYSLRLHGGPAEEPQHWADHAVLCHLHHRGHIPRLHPNAPRPGPQPHQEGKPRTRPEPPAPATCGGPITSFQLLRCPDWPLVKNQLRLVLVRERACCQAVVFRACTHTHQLARTLIHTLLICLFLKQSNISNDSLLPSCVCLCVVLTSYQCLDRLLCVRAQACVRACVCDGDCVCVCVRPPVNPPALGASHMAIMSL